MITLKNDFHNSSISIRAELGQWLSKSQIARARKALCGITGCTCGGNLGERGKQSVQVDAEASDRIRLL